MKALVLSDAVGLLMAALLCWQMHNLVLMTDDQRRRVVPRWIRTQLRVMRAVMGVAIVIVALRMLWRLFR